MDEKWKRRRKDICNGMEQDGLIKKKKLLNYNVHIKKYINHIYSLMNFQSEHSM